MFAIISYLFAYLNGITHNTNELLLGIGIFALLTGATNMINAYTDIEEDRVNNPIRIVWIRQLGLQNLLISTIATYLTVFCFSFLLGFNFAFVITIAIFDSIFYSLPPLRFKQHPVTALLAFSGAVSFPFLAGIVVAYDMIDITNPFFLLFSLFMFAYGTVKNIPDYIGDKIAGLKTTTTAFESYRMAVLVSTTILLTPYALLGHLVLSGTIATLYLLNLPLMIFPLYWGYSNLRTTKREISEKIHTYGFIYAISFLLFNLILTHPTVYSMTIAICVYSIIYFINKYEIDSRKEVPRSSPYLEFSHSVQDMATSSTSLDAE
jgi:4-hydroxybenzoate polyprenyltransferase